MTRNSFFCPEFPPCRHPAPQGSVESGQLCGVLPEPGGQVWDLGNPPPREVRIKAAFYERASHLTAGGAKSFEFFRSVLLSLREVPHEDREEYTITIANGSE